MRKEAALSSSIEGTQSSLSGLMTVEADGVPSIPMADVAEVSHYVAAAEHDLARQKEGMPLFLRLLSEMHGILLRQGRGVHQNPGENLFPYFSDLVDFEIDIFMGDGRLL